MKEKIAQLERDSQESSKPPSSDNQRGSNQKDKNHKNKGKPGGQHGHKETYRKLIPVHEVDKVIPIYPQICEGCDGNLPKEENANVVKEPYSWQVTEIPPLKPEVTEYQCFTVKCNCGHINKAQLPPEVAKSNFGPRLAAIIAYLVTVCHLSRRSTEGFCQTLLGIDICLGSGQNRWRS